MSASVESFMKQHGLRRLIRDPEVFDVLSEMVPGPLPQVNRSGSIMAGIYRAVVRAPPLVLPESLHRITLMGNTKKGKL